MTDIEKIVITSLFTITGGVIIFVTGQLLAKFFIEPIQELCKTIGEIRFNLSFHAPTIHTPIGRTKDNSESARAALMEGSSKLLSGLHSVPVYCATRIIAFGALPRRADIEEAAVQLRGLSTYMHEEGEKANNSIEEINKRVAKIEKLLRIKPLG